MIFKYNLDRIASGLFRDVFITFFLLLRFPQAPFFCPEKHIFEVFDMAMFQKISFWRKLDVWVTYLERYFIKVVRMDRPDHLGFR